MITPDDMIRMRRAGFTHREIAEIAGPPWTRPKVTYFLSKLGIQPEQKVVIVVARRPIKHDFSRELLMEMYWDCELSRAEIAYELDVPEPSLQQIFKRLAIPLRTASQSRRISVARYPHSAIGPTTEQQRAGAFAAAAVRRDRARRREMARVRQARRRELQKAA